MLKGLRGLIGPIVLMVTTIFHNVAPEAVEAVAGAAVTIVEGVGVLLTAIGVGSKAAAVKKGK